MSQQTINVGTSPNDGTGTPLRTAFQYTNSNFSELYTALGGGSGLPGSNGQVLFNNGTAIAGDAGLTYNPTTDALTITGDLTVNTSTLKVDSANSRVGIGIATPAWPLDIRSATAVAQILSTTGTNAAYLQVSNTGGIFYLGRENSAGTSFASPAYSAVLYAGGAYPLVTTVNGGERYRIASDGVATWSNVGGVAGTAMTLNSTGLGVGGSPNYKLNLSGAGSSFASSPSLALYDTTVGSPNSRNWLIGNVAANNYGELVFCVSSAAGGAPTNVQMTLNSSGNLGLGVTPSTYTAGFRAFEINSKGNGLMSYSNDNVYLNENAYYDGGWKYGTSATAGQYVIFQGSHRWNIAASGTAGNAITFTQAMTLDASGYLLLGTTDTAFTSGAGYKFGPGATPSSGQVGASTSNGDLTLRVYSTGAAAYRFYVGFGGTVYATNTTISAISDARLKENVQDIDVGLGAILALKPRKFDWKEGKGKNIKGDRGFIAQEFETVFPQLVDEWADPAPAGEAPYKSVRQDLIPVLVKAIQELAAEVNALKNA